MGDTTRGSPGYWLRLLFGFKARIDRRTYVLTGLALVVLKYVVDSIAFRLTTGGVWSPLGYLDPQFASAIWIIRSGGLLTLALWTVPFAWVGVSMSVRRAADAGWSPWLALLFCVPYANYALILLLCLVGTARVPTWKEHPATGFAGASLGQIVACSALGIVVAGAAVYVIVHFCKTYAAVLFVGVPLVFGSIVGFALNRWRPIAPGSTFGAVLASLAVLAVGLFVVAMEGAGCILMMLPIAVPLALLGAGLGREIALRTMTGPWHPCIVVIALPALAAIEARDADLPVHEVVSSIEIAAPPDVVWRRLIAFGEIPDPPEWMFRLGIACPKGAHIEGEGRGAVRYCEFSTGPFVEPITVWDEPRRLAFDVAAQPPPMIEWTPYDIHPPHLDGFLRSRRGEFRLIALPGGGTRLEGSTWYTLDIHPGPYWRLYADFLIGEIHGRVLRHIRRLAEAR